MINLIPMGVRILISPIGVVLGVVLYWTVNRFADFSVVLLQLQGTALEDSVLVHIVDYGLGAIVGTVFIIWLLRRNKKMEETQAKVHEEQTELVRDLVDHLKDSHKKKRK